MIETYERLGLLHMVERIGDFGVISGSCQAGNG